MMESTFPLKKKSLSCLQFSMREDPIPWAILLMLHATRKKKAAADTQIKSALLNSETRHTENTP